MSIRLALIFGGFALAGAVQLVLAHWLSRGTRTLVARGKRVGGRLVGKSTVGTMDGMSSRHDVVVYTTEDGYHGTVASRIGVPWVAHKDTPDRPLMVLYDPERPDRAVIDTWIELWAGPAIFYANGGLMVLAAAVCAVLVSAGVLPDDP